jgi:hypothetical protein
LRALILIHRYLGIAVGLLMLMWCLSGLVMIYVPWPHIEEQRRIAQLAPIDWARVTALAGLIPDPSAPVTELQLEMLGGSPVLRIRFANSPLQLLQLEALPTRYPGRQVPAARLFMGLPAGGGALPTVELMDHDQWTVSISSVGRPLYRVSIGDPSALEVYVSSRSGRIVQATRRSERFWGMLGAVPHWFYLSSLRSHPYWWTQVVIWTSALGVFLTAIGLLIGIRVLLQMRKANHFSPYPLLLRWHHLYGLLFGVFTLSWVLSGLLSMNPWGLLEAEDSTEARARLTGPAPSANSVQELLRNLAAVAPANVQSVSAMPLDGQLFAVAVRGDGARVRYSGEGVEEDASNAQITAAVHRLTGMTSVWTRLAGEDEYYYSMPDRALRLPVIRTEDARGNLYYLDPVSVDLVYRANNKERAFRWWHSALHRWDFAGPLRTDCGRTFVMLPLLAGTTLLTALGTYLAWRRIRRRGGRWYQDK